MFFPEKLYALSGGLVPHGRRNNAFANLLSGHRFWVTEIDLVYTMYNQYSIAVRVWIEEDCMGLAEKTCVPCRGGVPPLTRQQIEAMLPELEGWEVKEDKRLEKSFKFDDFAQAMRLANAIAEIAEHEGHHPDLLVRWGELKVELWTHKIDGLTESDFILAAKIDQARAALA